MDLAAELIEWDKRWNAAPHGVARRELLDIAQRATAERDACVARLHSEGYSAPHEDPPPALRCADGSAPCPECGQCFRLHAANCSRRFARGVGP